MASVEALGAGNSSWDEVDGFGIYIFGATWLRGLIKDADVRRWAKDTDLWRRRAALVATVVLNLKAQGGRGDTRRTLDIATRLIDDRQDMVVKAMSWSLRSLVRWDKSAVENFLADHEDRLAARVKRETRTKLRTGKKNGVRARTLTALLSRCPPGAVKTQRHAMIQMCAGDRPVARFAARRRPPDGSRCGFRHRWLRARSHLLRPWNLRAQRKPVRKRQRWHPH